MAITQLADDYFRAVIAQPDAAQELIDLFNSVQALSSSEAAFLDGVTAGTVLASKAVVVDASKDVGTLRDVTLETVVFSGATGACEITVTDNLADALSVKIAGGADIISIDSTNSNEKLLLLSASTQKLGFYGTAPAVQPSHVADPAAMASITAASVTLTNMEDGSADNTLEAITDTSMSDQSGAIERNFDKIGDEINALVVDVAAAKTAIDANNAAIDSILAQLATLGLQAAS